MDDDGIFDLLIIPVGALLVGVILFFIISRMTTSGGEVITSPICPTDTCSLEHQHSDEDFTIPYSSELNINSPCDEIKNYILENLESSHSDAFQSSDDKPITDSMKKELIFVLENSLDMIFDPPFTNPSGEQITRGPGIRFKFCCPDEHICIVHE